MSVEMWGRHATRTPGVGVRIEADPLGPVNKIVRLHRLNLDGTSSSIKAALHRVPRGTLVELSQVIIPVGEREIRHSTWHLRGVSGWRVTVDGRTVLCATDSEIWPPAPAEPVPWRVRTHRAVKSWLRTRVRAAGDRVAARFGYVHEDEAGQR